MNHFEFISTYYKKFKVIINKNITDEVFHIYLNNGAETVNQIYFNKEDAKKIIKALKEMIKEG